jgi:hypothetical protein
VAVPGYISFTKCCETNLCNNIPISTLDTIYDIHIKITNSKTPQFSMSLGTWSLFVMGITLFIKNYF